MIDFPDYSTDEILQIVELVGAKQHYELDEDARDKLRAVLDAAPRTKGFGNARVGRNLFEAASQPPRLAGHAPGRAHRRRT